MLKFATKIGKMLVCVYISGLCLRLNDKQKNMTNELSVSLLFGLYIYRLMYIVYINPCVWTVGTFFSDATYNARIDHV
jgi:hypothetical protein